MPVRIPRGVFCLSSLRAGRFLGNEPGGAIKSFDDFNEIICQIDGFKKQ